MRCIYICLFLLSLNLVVQAEKKEEKSPLGQITFRKIHGLVVKLDGKPAPYRKVHLIGLSRWSMRPNPQDGSPMPLNWDYETDSQGRFTACLGEFNTYEDKQGRPGWGDYALIVDEAGFNRDAGGVFSRIIHSKEVEKRRNEWGREWGEWVYLPSNGLHIKIPLKRGITLEGWVWGAFALEKPLKGIEVYVKNDLHANTHTGHGGSIFARKAITDEDGHFVIQNIYPARFDVSFGEIDHAIWLRTKRNGKWVDDCLDEIIPPIGTRKMQIEFAASRENLCRYYGRVVDEKGRGVPNAKVIFAVSYHLIPKTWEDSHHHVSVETDKSGQYEVELETPWIRGMSAEVKGYKRHDRWYEDFSGKCFLPGKYDFVLVYENQSQKKP